MCFCLMFFNIIYYYIIVYVCFFACIYGNHWQSIWKYNRNSTGANFHHNHNQELHDPKITVHPFLLRLVEPCLACRRGWARLAPNIGKTQSCGSSTKNRRKGRGQATKICGYAGLRPVLLLWKLIFLHGPWLRINIWDGLKLMNWWTSFHHCSTLFCISSNVRGHIPEPGRISSCCL